MDKKLPLTFILSFCREAAKDHGEDSYCYSFGQSAGLIGVFDGCGGAGARKQAAYSGKTEAYMASRLCAGSFYDTFREWYPCACSARQLASEVFAPNALRRLSEAEPPKSGGPQIRGTMIRTLPTTAAAALIRAEEGGCVRVSPMWAGDSRVYVMDGKGLAQLTVDNTTVPDPMQTLYDDGLLRNIFCTDRQVKLHCSTVMMQGPFVAFAATDGCFGYFSTPMEFEGMLLKTLLGSANPAQWEQRLIEAISAVAGDDHTMCLAAFGYQDFAQLQDTFRRRYALLQQQYLALLAELPMTDANPRFAMWETYKGNYSRYLEDGAQ